MHCMRFLCTQRGKCTSFLNWDLIQSDNSLIYLQRYVVTWLSLTTWECFRNILNTTESWIRQGFDSDPNKIYLEDYENLSFDSILSFYNKEIKNKPIIISIVGDFSRINIDELKKFGKVIKLKESNIFVN